MLIVVVMELEYLLKILYLQKTVNKISNYYFKMYYKIINKQRDGSVQVFRIKVKSYS